MCYVSPHQGLAAIVFATFVDQGKISYDHRVTKYWPEYGQNGKEETTILQLLNHQVRTFFEKGAR